MCPNDLIAIVSALTIKMANEIPPEELAVYASIFNALGESLALWLVQQERLEDKCTKKDNSCNVC